MSYGLAVYGLRNATENLQTLLKIARDEYQVVKKVRVLGFDDIFKIQP